MTTPPMLPCSVFKNEFIKKVSYIIIFRRESINFTYHYIWSGMSKNDINIKIRAFESFCRVFKLMTTWNLRTPPTFSFFTVSAVYGCGTSLHKYCAAIDIKKFAIL